MIRMQFQFILKKQVLLKCRHVVTRDTYRSSRARTGMCSALAELEFEPSHREPSFDRSLTEPSSSCSRVGSLLYT